MALRCTAPCAQYAMVWIVKRPQCYVACTDEAARFRSLRAPQSSPKDAQGPARISA